MATFIEIGPVPRKETPCCQAIAAAVAAGVFLRQLNRMRPLAPACAARYTLAQRAPGSKPWITVQLAVMVDSWNTADLAHDIANSAYEIDYWDDQAQRELRDHGIALQSSIGQLAVAV